MFDADSEDTAWNEKIISSKFVGIVSDDDESSSYDRVVVINLAWTISISNLIHGSLAAVRVVTSGVYTGHGCITQIGTVGQ